MVAAVEMQVSSPRDLSEPYSEPPEGVTVLRSKRKMGFDGVDVLALDILVEAGKAVLPVVATWIYDTFRSKQPEKTTIQIVVGGDAHIARDADAVRVVLQERSGV